MSSTVPAIWQGVGSVNSGNWTDATHWTTASVPGASTVAVLGPSVTATAPWVVSVTGAQQAGELVMEMSSVAGAAIGGLAIGGTLTVGGSIEIGGGAIRGGNTNTPGGTISVAAGGALIGKGNLVAALSTINLAGGIVSTAGYSDIYQSAATIQGGGSWSASEMYIGQFFTANVLLQHGSLHLLGLLDLGQDPTMPGAGGPQGIATLSVDGGSNVTALSLAVLNQSTLSVDATSGVALGGAATVAGAVVIGNSGRADLEAVQVAANVVDNGILSAARNAANTTVHPDLGPTVTGAVTGSGILHVGSNYTLEVGSAAGFAGRVSLDPTATLVIDAGASPSGRISMYHATIDLRGLTFSGGLTPTYNATTGVLTLGTDALNVGTGLAATDFTTAADAHGGTLLAEVSCYAAGTAIATPSGEVAVEALRPGHLVRTATGRLAPVTWVGRMAIDLTRHPAPQHAAPVRIAAGAFAPGLPRRDLVLSPDHALMIAGALIPARKLVNGATIRQDLDAESVTYVHVELDRHDLLLAEGLPAESYLDTGNRGQFTGGDLHGQPPRFDLDPEAAVLRIFAERGCAPLLLRGEEVQSAHARLLARARVLGWRLLATPALAVEGDCGGLAMAHDGPDRVHAILPAGMRRVRLRSRHFTPEMLHPDCGDGRRLGVAVGVALDGKPLGERAFARGWHVPDASTDWRWTDGDATLVLPRRRRPGTLTLTLFEAGARYWAAPSRIAPSQLELAA
ncbi:MAG: Hint domain-containing protein [Alphaproteobacteria bacterium]|nr:Hint domain-containing protein [Alphaproteobacteria bacterium]